MLHSCRSHLVFLCVKCVCFLNTFRRRISISRNFSASFWNLVPTSFTLIFMFQVPNNLFRSSKYFIWVHHVPKCLSKFSPNFRRSRSIFRGLNINSGHFYNYFGGIRLVINQLVVPVDLESLPEDRSCLYAVYTLRLYSLY